MAALGSALLLAFSAPVQAAAVTANGTPAAVATNNVQNWPAGPETTSEAAVLIDADTGAVLYDKGMNEYRYPASTTKLMTILLATENSSPKDVVTFTETGIRDVTWDSSNINAQLGEQMTMKDCWFAAYIKSANEVCAQIAEYVGGTELFQPPGSCKDHACRTSECEIPQSDRNCRIYDPGNKLKCCKTDAYTYAADGKGIRPLL